MADEAEQLKEKLRPMANFARRAGIIVNGREKLRRLQRQLQFILVTDDISANSLEEALHNYTCKIYQALTSSDLEELFGMQNAKIIGFKQNPLAGNIEQQLTEKRIT